MNNKFVQEGEKQKFKIQLQLPSSNSHPFEGGLPDWAGRMSKSLVSIFYSLNCHPELVEGQPPTTTFYATIYILQANHSPLKTPNFQPLQSTSYNLHSTTSPLKTPHYKLSFRRRRNLSVSTSNSTSISIHVLFFCIAQKKQKSRLTKLPLNLSFDT